MGDETRLRQVLLNLLNNAVKFTDQGTIWFRARPLADSLWQRTDGQPHYTTLRFEVEDTGIGIQAEMLEQIFLPFGQAHAGHSATKGTGLGLPICQHVLRLMGSEIQVESEPHQGSRFWFDVCVLRAQPPAECAEASTGVDAPATPARSARRRIHSSQGTVLIIDDHEMNRAVIGDMIKSLGLTILEADNGFDGLEKARRFSPDIVLMDMMMPTMDGFETTRQLRQQMDSEQPLIVGVSASIADDVKIRSLEAGCDTFLPKPIQLPALLNVLEQHFGLTFPPEPASGPVAGPKPSEEAAIIPPPPWQLEALLELARGGDIAGLHAMLPGLAAENPAMRAFADHLGSLVKRFHMNDIKVFLEQLRSEECP